MASGWHYSEKFPRGLKGFDLQPLDKIYYVPTGTVTTTTTTTTAYPDPCHDCIVISNWTGSPTGWADAFERDWEKYKSDGVPELWNGKPVWAADWSALSYGDNQGVLWYTPASQGLIAGGGWCITSTLGSQDLLRPRAFAASGNEACPIDATWSSLTMTGYATCPTTTTTTTSAP